MRMLCKTILVVSGLVLAASGRAQPAPVQPAPANPVDVLVESAARGDFAPTARALEQAQDPDLRAVLRAQLAAARFEGTVLNDPALTRLAAGEDPVLRRAALSVLTSAAFVQADFAAAARFGRQLAEALAASGDTEFATETERSWRLAALLAEQPRQALAGPVAPGGTAMRIDRVGLPRIDMAVNGQAQEAVFDTGAAFSVLSAETARRMGVRVIETETSVGNGVQGTVSVRVGIADRLEVAGNALTNVPFLIVDDSQLTFPLPGGYDIKAILGLPVMRALGRLRVEAAGRLAVLPAAPAAGPANMHANTTSVFVDVAIDGRAFPLLLDTGANQTRLTALYAEAVPAAVAGLETRMAGSASAGGARQDRVATWANAPLALGGRQLRLPELPIALPGEGTPPRVYGVLGSNVLRAFESYTLDFAAMRLDLGEPLQVAAR